MDLWWNKSCLWDSSWPSEQFYGNVRVKGIRKWSTREIFDSIIFKFKEGFENTHFKAKKIAKNFKGALSGLRQVLVTESPLKMAKNIRDSHYQENLCKIFPQPNISDSFSYKKVSYKKWVFDL